MSKVEGLGKNVMKYMYLTILSSPPEATRRESGENLAVLTQF